MRSFTRSKTGWSKEKNKKLELKEFRNIQLSWPGLSPAWVNSKRYLIGQSQLMSKKQVTQWTVHTLKFDLRVTHTFRAPWHSGRRTRPDCDAKVPGICRRLSTASFTVVSAVCVWPFSNLHNWPHKFAWWGPQICMVRSTNLKSESANIPTCSRRCSREPLRCVCRTIQLALLKSRVGNLETPSDWSEPIYVEKAKYTLMWRELIMFSTELEPTVTAFGLRDRRLIGFLSTRTLTTSY